jgi:hypothetical protein
MQLNLLWATKQNAQVGFCIAWCDTGPERLRPGSPKRTAGYQARPILFMWGVVPSFRFAVFVAASQKIRFRQFEKIKKHFSWDKTKIGFRSVPRYLKGHKRV